MTWPGGPLHGPYSRGCANRALDRVSPASVQVCALEPAAGGQHLAAFAPNVERSELVDALVRLQKEQGGNATNVSGL